MDLNDLDARIGRMDERMNQSINNLGLRIGRQETRIMWWLGLLSMAVIGLFYFVSNINADDIGDSIGKALEKRFVRLEFKADRQFALGQKYGAYDSPIKLTSLADEFLDSEPELKKLLADLTKENDATTSASAVYKQALDQLGEEKIRAISLRHKIKGFETMLVRGIIAVYFCSKFP